MASQRYGVTIIGRTGRGGFRITGPGLPEEGAQVLDYWSDKVRRSAIETILETAFHEGGRLMPELLTDPPERAQPSLPL
jgi:hypothetical protein